MANEIEAAKYAEAFAKRVEAVTSCGKCDVTPCYSEDDEIMVFLRQIATTKYVRDEAGKIALQRAKEVARTRAIRARQEAKNTIQWLMDDTEGDAPEDSGQDEGTE